MEVVSKVILKRTESPLPRQLHAASFPHSSPGPWSALPKLTDPWMSLMLPLPPSGLHPLGNCHLVPALSSPPPTPADGTQ